MVSHAIRSRSGSSATLLVTGCLLLALSLASMTPTRAERVDKAAASREDLNYPSAITLNEVMPNPNSDWNGDGAISDASDEYIELYNDGSTGDVDLSGWKLDDIAGDESPEYVFPPNTILRAGLHLVMFSADTRVALDNSDGDTVRLIRPDNSEADTFCYTDTASDQAYSRTNDGSGTWTTAYPPSPGTVNQPSSAPTPTPTSPSMATPSPTSPSMATPSPTETLTTTPSNTPTPTTEPSQTSTVTPSATAGSATTSTPLPAEVSLNEFMPDPASDWNGNGQTGDADDEYIELFNNSALPTDVSGWLLDDIAGGGSPPFALPPGTSIPPAGFLVFFSAQTHLSLNNSGDTVRLVRPDGVQVETVSYTATRPDRAHSKTLEGGVEWTTGYPPSPGASNQSQPTATPTASAVPTTATVTGSPTPDPSFVDVTLNEFMPDPASDWNGDGTVSQDDEYIELFNAGSALIDLGGWMLDDVDDSQSQARSFFAPDGSRPFVIPVGTIIDPGGFALFFRSDTGVTLNNDGDWVRLLRPNSAVAEAYEYAASRDDQAYSKTQDGGDEWTRTYPPSPGQPNDPGFTGNERVRLNELLSSPKEIDWDGDGVANYLDEWIELLNLGEEPVQLAGWALVEGPDASTGHRYVFPADTTLEVGQYLMIYRRQSQLALNASEESVHLLFPDDTPADSTHYTSFAGYDQSWCRLPNGTGEWSVACIETPGGVNLPDIYSGGDDEGNDTPLPPYDRFNHSLVSIALARTLPDNVRVTLEGQVTVLPDIFDDKQIYIQDITGGMLVYLRSGEWPPLSEGQWVRVNGRLDTLYGEKEIKLTRIDDIKTMQPAAPPTPRPISTSEVGEATEGWLVHITAPASGFRGRSVVLLDNEGSDTAVVFKQSTGMLRPYVEIGEMWAVVGVVSQDDDEAPFDSGYRILPRRSADVQPGAKMPTTAAPMLDNATWNAAPLFLPVTGAAGQSPPLPKHWLEYLVSGPFPDFRLFWKTLWISSTLLGGPR